MKGRRAEQSLPDESELVEEYDGKLASSPDEERLMRSVLENDEDAVKDGQLLADALNNSAGAFTPDLLFENLVRNYQNAERLYGKTLIGALTSYAPEYVERNVRIREFQDELRDRIAERYSRLAEEGLVEDGFVTEKGARLAGLLMYVEELDALVSKGLGRKEAHERHAYGEKAAAVPFRRGAFRFRDVALRRSVNVAVRRGHASVEPGDLQAYEREERGRIQVVYALDASGSMRGEKIGTSKKAGIALAHRAVEERNEVGLIVFTKEVERSVPPTRDFPSLLVELARMRPGSETNLAATILHAAELFSAEECTKHLLLLTDAVPTRGKDPRQETLDAAGVARDRGITISLVGIALDGEGESLARTLVEIGGGRLYRVTDLDELDRVLLEDYDAL